MKYTWSALTSYLHIAQSTYTQKLFNLLYSHSHNITHTSFIHIHIPLFNTYIQSDIYIYYIHSHIPNSTARTSYIPIHIHYFYTYEGYIYIFLWESVGIVCSWFLHVYIYIYCNCNIKLGLWATSGHTPLLQQITKGKRGNY